MWKGDNTQSGPENIMVFIDNAQLEGVFTERIYKIHFNHFGAAAANPHVRVTVTGNDKTLTATVGAATRKSQRAETSDPFVLILFDASNTPISIR